MKNIFNLAVCVPSLHTWECHFSHSLQTLILEMSQKRVPGYDDNGVVYFNEVSSVLCQARFRLVKKAIAADATHILFVDSDQTFPGMIVHCMARHRKQIVGCNVATKVLPSQPTARNKSEVWWGGDKVYTFPHSKGLEQVWRVGFGVMLLDVKVFEKIPKPWFMLRYLPAEEEFVGEDWYFCEEAEKAGIPIYIDHDASKKVGHIGQFNFGHEHVELPEPVRQPLKLVGESA